MKCVCNFTFRQFSGILSSLSFTFHILLSFINFCCLLFEGKKKGKDNNMFYWGFHADYFINVLQVDLPLTSDHPYINDIKL